MILGVLSDTHGEVEMTRLAADVFRRFEVGCVIHCGDIGSMEVVAALHGLPVHYVFGNCDGATARSVLEPAIEVSHQHCHGMFGELELEGKRIFFLHGHQDDRFATEIESGHWDLICYGHTHSRSLHIEHGTLLLNPGALYRVSRPSVVIVDLPAMDVTPVVL